MLKRREGAMESAKTVLAILLGDTLTELGLDGRSYEDNTAVAFVRVVPGADDGRCPHALDRLGLDTGV